MRYEGAVYRRDSSNDAETLYVCTGNEVRTGEFEPCRGKVAFELIEIWGELIEQKIRLIGYNLHSPWCQFFTTNEKLIYKASIDGSSLLGNESRGEGVKAEQMQITSGDALNFPQFPMIREPESPPKINKERPRNAEYKEEIALSDRSGDEGFNDETYSISSDDEVEILDESDSPVMDFGYSRDNLMKAAPTYLRSLTEKYPSDKQKIKPNFRQRPKIPPNEMPTSIIAVELAKKLCKTCEMISDLPTIQCDRCEYWFHSQCEERDVDERPQAEHWYCSKCWQISEKLEKALGNESSDEEKIKESKEDLNRRPINSKLAELRKSFNEQREIVDDLKEKMKKNLEGLEDLEREIKRNSNKYNQTWRLNGQAAMNQNRVCDGNRLMRTAGELRAASAWSFEAPLIL